MRSRRSNNAVLCSRGVMRQKFRRGRYTDHLQEAELSNGHKQHVIMMICIIYSLSHRMAGIQSTCVLACPSLTLHGALMLSLESQLLTVETAFSAIYAVQAAQTPRYSIYQVFPVPWRRSASTPLSIELPAIR